MVRGLIFVALFAGPVAALAADCESIPKSDARKHCLATLNNSASQCYGIGSSDTRNLCLAQVEKSPAHCRHIRNEGRREQCPTLAR